MANTDIQKEPESLVTVRFHDCDPFGHLNNTKHIEYFITAREDHLKDFYGFDIYERSNQTNENWYITKTQIVYFAPAMLMEHVRIKTRLINFSSISILIEGIMTDESAAQIKSIAWIEFRYVNLTANRLARHPAELLSFLESIRFNAEGIDSFDKRTQIIKKMHSGK